MQIPSPILLTGLALATGSGPAPAVATAPATGARVLIVDIDDMGFDLLRDTPTPTLDWLEANGRYFTSFTAAPLCTPSRAVMNTGAYSSHPGLLIGGNISPGSPNRLDPQGLVALARLVSDAGLRTAKIGKWHLAGDQFKSNPNDNGWSEYRGVLGNIGIVSASYDDFPKVINGVETNVAGVYCTTDETNDAIARVAEGYELISLSYHAPHAPFHVPPPHLHNIAPIADDRDRARAMLQACDAEFGRLVRAALPRGYTILVYGDNGTSTQIGGEKGSLRDGGIRVPLWAIGPGVRAGLDDSRIGVVDLYATATDLLGVARAGPALGPHSRSFTRALRGEGEARRWTYAEHFPAIGVDPRLGTTRWRRAVRGERFKRITDSDTGTELLYDLDSDPGELRDLLSSGSLGPEAAAALGTFRAALARL